MIQPSKLSKGDSVILIAPSRKVELEDLKSAEKLLINWGLFPIRAKNILAENGIFAGSDQQRKEDLQWAMDHPTAKAIWCFRGGYGSVRLIEQINPSGFISYPKWLIGFSDITVLHCFSNIILNASSIHATMPINVRENTSNSLDSLKKTLFENKFSYSWEWNSNNKLSSSKGEITGGNLSVLCSMLGTNYQPDFENKILFIEDVDEYLYQIDRMLWQLKFAGVFHHIKGLIIGHFSNIKDNKIPFGKSFEEIILEKIREFDFPVAFDFSAGHENENCSFILGREARLETSKTKSTLITI